MDATRAGKIYDSFIRKADPEDLATKGRLAKLYEKTSDEVADAVLAYAAVLAPGITGSGQFPRALEVLKMFQGIDSAAKATHITPAEFTRMLALWNTWFGRADTSFAHPPHTPTEIVAMLVEIENQGWHNDVGFKAYAATSPGSAFEFLFMRKEFINAGLGTTAVVLLLHFLQQHLVPVVKLRATNADAIHHLAKLTPPLAGFAGFADWGPGNNREIERNKKNHFFKHVIDTLPDDGTEKPWPDEFETWWRKLDIKLSREVAQAKMGGTFNLVQALFPADAKDVLPFDKVKPFLAALKGIMPQPLIDQLVADHGAKYAATAITLSQSMTDIIIHTDNSGSGVYLKGVNGDFYIGGRMEKDTLGISTCFVPKPEVDKATVNNDKMLWRVSKA